jgi:hypothetical protein
MNKGNLYNSFLITIVSILIIVGSVKASTTISTNIDTTGTITSSATSTASAFVATNANTTSTLSGGLRIAGSSGLTVLPNGNVGIGTSTSANKLYVSDLGSEKESLFIDRNDTNGVTAIQINNSNSSDGAVSAIGLSASGGGNLTMVAENPATSWSGQAGYSFIGSLGGLQINSLDGDVRLTVGDEGGVVVASFGFDGVGIGTTSPFSKFHVTAGASATTTVNFGSVGLTSSKACFNTKNTVGSDISFYFVGTSMVVENRLCR